MTSFIAIKIHYDHRRSLAPHLKYSRLPTMDEYNVYLDLFYNDGVGGNGFHECLNFAISDNGMVQMYLPQPTCLPAQDRLDDDFVIFSFTYGGDQELPAHIVGVHAGAKILNRDGITRTGLQTVDGIDEPFDYHAESPESLVTLFTPPIEYDFHAGIHTPPYQRWGFGLRYIDNEHARNIIKSAFDLASEDLPIANVSKKEILEREINVLKEIDRKYFSSSICTDVNTPKINWRTEWTPPDKEIGYLGEKIVYEQELSYANSIGVASSEVEWISQASPQSPFDIKSVRKTKNGIEDYFIEVKSSRANDDSNIYLSSRQIEFFKQDGISGAFFFVTFETNNSLKGVRELSLQQLMREFDLLPIKYKLVKR
jgi:hypothetical protein